MTQSECQFKTDTKSRMIVKEKDSTKLCTETRVPTPKKTRPIRVISQEPWILDSVLWYLDSRYWIPDSWSAVLGFRNSGSLELNSGFKGPRFWIPQAKIFRFPESGLPYTISLALHGANRDHGQLVGGNYCGMKSFCFCHIPFSLDFIILLSVSLMNDLLRNLPPLTKAPYFKSVFDHRWNHLYPLLRN